MVIMVHTYVTRQCYNTLKCYSIVKFKWLISMIRSSWFNDPHPNILLASHFTPPQVWWPSTRQLSTQTEHAICLFYLTDVLLSLAWQTNDHSLPSQPWSSYKNSTTWTPWLVWSSVLPNTLIVLLWLLFMVDNYQSLQVTNSFMYIPDYLYLLDAPWLL